MEFGGYIQLDRHWAYSLFKHMTYVQQKATIAKGKYTISDDLVQTVMMEKISPQLVFQMGIKIVPNSSYTLEQEGAESRNCWSH